MSVKSTLLFYLCHRAQESHFAGWQHNRKKCWERGENNDTNSVQVCVQALGPVYQILRVLQLTSLWPLKRKYWTPIHPSRLFLTLLCPFIPSSYLLFSSLVLFLWEVSESGSDQRYQGGKTVRKPTSLNQIVNIWWTVPPWISHSIP